MEKILNYKISPHFEERMRQRHIDSFLVSMCLVKGEMKELKKMKTKFILRKEQIIEAAKQKYVDIRDYLGLIELTVVVKNNILITTYGRYGDIGLSN